MDDRKKKMILFGSVGGAVLVILIVLVLVLALGGNKNQPTTQPSVQASNTNNEPAGSGTDSTATMDEMVSDLTNEGSTTAVSASNSSSAGGASQNNTTKKGQTTTTSKKPATTTTFANASKTYSLLTDPTFKNGFKALGLDSSDGGANGRAIFNPLNTNGRQYWNLASWGSRYAFGDSKYTTMSKLSSGVFRYTNPTKVFTVDTNTGALTFTGITSKCYDKPRTGSEPWLHLLIEQSFSAANSKLTDLDKVQLSLSNRLTMFKDNMGSAFNPNVHAAQFLMYLSVKNNDSSSPEYNRYIWFGIPLFDNRYEWQNSSSMLDKGTNSLMVGIGTRVLYQATNMNNCWKNGKINAGSNVAWSKFSIDLLPLIKDAINTAHKDGYLTKTSYDQLVISGMNLGWEIPGSYDATMELKDFSLMATRK